MKLKKIVGEILHTEEEKKGLLYMIDDYFISGLIILNVIAIILESYHNLYQSHKLFFDSFDYISVIIFTAEYIARIWVADIQFKEYGPVKSRLKYIFSPMGIIDLVAILPFYLPFIIKLDLRFLRILRLLRIFKLAHYFQSLRLVSNVISNKKSELLITVFGALIMILMSASLMYELEHDVQPDKFPNIFATFWWAIATLTTIGYGDVFPVTGWGQFIAAVTALFGIGLVAIPTGILSMGFMEEIQKKKAEKEGVTLLTDEEREKFLAFIAKMQDELAKDQNKAQAP